MIDENWEPDTKRFKVICQACGEDGVIDFDEQTKKARFMIHWIDDEGEEYEYNLCLDCEEMIYPPEPHKGS